MTAHTEGPSLKRFEMGSRKSDGWYYHASLIASLLVILSTPASAQMQAGEAYGKLPLSFEANQGQTDAEVKFLSRGRGYTLFLTATEAVLALGQVRPDAESPGVPKPGRSERTAPTPLRIQFLGTNPTSQATGLDELPGQVNYFIGNDPEKWRTNVPTYAQVKYLDIYPGVHLVYYGNPGQLEYDFIIAPGGDPRTITLSFDGTDKLEIADQGDLVLHVAGGEVLLRKPLIYQEIDGAKRGISGHYVLKGEGQVGFLVGPYDEARSLIIDPTLSYSTYLGGSGDDEVGSIAVDAAGNAYVTGFTESANFPTTAGAVQPAAGGVAAGVGDAFVAKLSADGSALLYSTYLGGSGNDSALGIAVDPTGNAYVTGATLSTDFPTTAGAFQVVISGGGVGVVNAFVTKLSSTGSALDYSTYLGGDAVGRAIAVDNTGSAYVTGFTTGGFPTTVGAFQETHPGGTDAFVTKVNPTGSALMYSTYLGGSGIFGDGGESIAVDSAGNAYVTGFTRSVDFPVTVGAFQVTKHGQPGEADAFVTKVNQMGAALVYSTYLGGTFADGGSGIAVDTAGNAYVTGSTVSSDFPTTPGTLQPAAGGASNAFVTKLSADGSALLYSTYLGGSGDDSGSRVTVDAAGNAHVIGATNSVDFPTASAIQPAFAGGSSDVFVAKLNSAGSGLIYSTYLGGTATDFAVGIALDGAGNAYVTGFTRSVDFPTANPLQVTNAGGIFDAFVAKIAPTLALMVSKAGSGSGTVSSFPAGISCGTDCSESYSSGTAVTLTATAASDSTFAGWSGDSDCVDGVVTIDAAKACTATFNVATSNVATFTLTVSKTGTGGGTVLASPGPLDCGSTCTAEYVAGTTVTLTAQPNSDASFDGWGGACTGAFTCTVVMTANLQVTAQFTHRSKLEGFIIDFYRVILLRVPSEAEIAVWRDALTRLGPEGARIAAYGFLTSPEYLNRPQTVFEHVDVLYQALLSREPESAGRTAWAYAIVGRLNGLIPGFFNSQEFQGLLRSTSLATLVTRFYQYTLLRDPEPEGLAAWVDYLARSGHFYGMAVGFLNSPEYLNTQRTLAQHVTLLYHTFLGREPDPVGLAAWTGWAVSQLAPITDGFVDSIEFRTKFAALFQ